MSYSFRRAQRRKARAVAQREAKVARRQVFREYVRTRAATPALSARERRRQERAA